MNKIFCEIHLFDIYQTIYIVNCENGEKTVRAQAVVEDLPAAIAALSNETKYNKVVLAGNKVFAQAVADDIIAYSKRHYNWTDNEIEIEVL